MEICKTDLARIIKYLTEAALLYDQRGSLSARCRAWSIRQLVEKLEKRSANLKEKK